MNTRNITRISYKQTILTEIRVLFTQCSLARPEKKFISDIISLEHYSFFFPSTSRNIFCFNFYKYFKNLLMLQRAILTSR